jgi:beta-carotene 15,15'-dioxygenase
MKELLQIKPIGAAFPPLMRLWALPFLVIILIAVNLSDPMLNSVYVTALASVAIVLAGLPHGTLDIEIASLRFGRSDARGKIAITAAYISCAATMVMLWILFAELALAAFLIISIIHFSADWRGGVEPFLAVMVGWALIALPALSHPASVAMIFETLTGNNSGATITAILACTSVPAALGSFVFVLWSYRNNDYLNGTDVLSCLVAAVCLPPLISFALFFCGLHSPRHMVDALKETGALTPRKKMMIVMMVMCLALGLGTIFYTYDGSPVGNEGIIRTAFILISVLTVPHFVLEHITAQKSEQR